VPHVPSAISIRLSLDLFKRGHAGFCRPHLADCTCGGRYCLVKATIDGLRLADVIEATTHDINVVVD
jgi:hypothetical protein